MQSTMMVKLESTELAGESKDIQLTYIISILRLLSLTRVHKCSNYILII